MGVYAVLDEATRTVVEAIAIWDGVTTWAPSSRVIAIPDGAARPSIGATYAGDVFTPPASTPASPIVYDKGQTLAFYAPTPTFSGPTTTSTTFAAAIPQMTQTFAPLTETSDVCIQFSGTFVSTNSSATTDVAVYVDGVLVAQRGGQHGATSPRRIFLSIEHWLTPAIGQHVVEVRWRTSTGTLTCEGLQRQMTITERAATD